jgi:nitroreductase
VDYRDILARRRMHRAFLPDPLPREQIDRIANVIRHAPSGGFSQGASIVVVTEQETRQAIARALLVRLAAVDEGLASAFVGHPDQKRIFDELLGLPEDVVPLGLALIGKPGASPPVGSRLRSRQRPLDDLVHWERW